VNPTLTKRYSTLAWPRTEHILFQFERQAPV
jgi:hypothetical protein